MFKYIFIVSLQYFLVLSLKMYQENSSKNQSWLSQDRWSFHSWPISNNSSKTSTQSTTTCPSCISQINDECNVKTYGCNNRNCCYGLVCQLYNRNIPELGGTCQCPNCQPLNQSCLTSSIGCDRRECCPGLKCMAEESSDEGGICRKDCSKCKRNNKRCTIYAPRCSPNSCCEGFVCVKTNPDTKGATGICRIENKWNRSCPECQPLNHGCQASVNSCIKNQCCDDLVCVKNITTDSPPDFGGICTKVEDVPPVVKPKQTCSLNATCNLPGEPCLGRNTTTCAQNPCCDTNLFYCVGNTSDKPGFCQRIPIMDYSKLIN